MIDLALQYAPLNVSWRALHKYRYTLTLWAEAMRHVSQWLVGDATRLSVVGWRCDMALSGWLSTTINVTSTSIGKPSRAYLTFKTPGGGEVTRLSVAD